MGNLHVPCHHRLPGDDAEGAPKQVAWEGPGSREARGEAVRARPQDAAHGLGRGGTPREGDTTQRPARRSPTEVPDDRRSRPALTSRTPLRRRTNADDKNQTHPQKTAIIRTIRSTADESHNQEGDSGYATAPSGSCSTCLMPVHPTGLSTERTISRGASVAARAAGPRPPARCPARSRRPAAPP